ncbi:MAG: hypothetical protein Q9185_006966 [Variospora sp. 1 TL-2023]
MTAQKTPTTPEKDFLGNLIEICIVTRSYRTTLSALIPLGLSPWRIYTCSPSNTQVQTYRGQPAAYSMKLCFATLPNSSIVYEVIQPISGPSIFADYLGAHAAAGADGGGGLHHLAYDCHGVPMAERVRGFRERGYEMVQSGVLGTGVAFMFFEGRKGEGEGDGGGTGGMWLETIQIEEGGWPEVEEWFPGPPDDEEGKEEEVKVEG